MRWIYKVTWMDGQTHEMRSTRRSSVPAGGEANQMTIYVNPHGHDQRYDEVIIPLANVRMIQVVEVQR